MMRATRWSPIMLVVLMACTTTITFQDELASKEVDQHGPKILLAAGRLANGDPWIFYVYRSAGKGVCFKHAWLHPTSHSRGSQGACTPPQGPHTVQSSATFPSETDPYFSYLIGAVADARAATVRWRIDGQTQDLRILRDRRIPELGFTIAPLQLPHPPDTVELLDEDGSVLHSEPFRD
jgi:hypothetical protein